MGGYGTVAALLLAGWTFLNAEVAWVYLAAAALFELWLLGKVNAMGRHPAATGEPPYDFTEEDAERTTERRGRNTLIALTNSFFTMWRANEASIGERTLGVLGFGSIFWLGIMFVLTMLTAVSSFPGF